MIKFSKICLEQDSIFENFENLRNFFLIREMFVCSGFTMQICRRYARSLEYIYFACLGVCPFVCIKKR